MGNITFGSFIAEKRKAHKFNLRDTAKHLNIAYGYLCDIEQSRRPAPTGDFMERISAFLNLDKSEHELLLDLAAKSRNTVSADLPDYRPPRNGQSQAPFLSSEGSCNLQT